MVKIGAHKVKMYPMGKNSSHGKIILVGKKFTPVCKKITYGYLLPVSGYQLYLQMYRLCLQVYIHIAPASIENIPTGIEIIPTSIQIVPHIKTLKAG